MVFIINVLILLFQELGINLRGRDIGMAQHFLHILELRAVFQKVRSEGVAERVGRNVFLNIGLLRIGFDDFPEALPGKALAVHVGEERVLLLTGQDDAAAAAEVIGYRFYRVGVKRHDPLRFIGMQIYDPHLDINVGHV